MEDERKAQFKYDAKRPGILAGQPQLEGFEVSKDAGAATKLGYDLGEVTSAMIKELRRGKEEEAAFWALELYEAAPFYVWKRLLLFASEDVGTGDPMAVVQVAALCQAWLFCRQSSRSPWVDPQHLMQAVLVLCRAKKCNEVDDLKNLIVLRRKACEAGKRPKPEIPDYALDQHTRRGRAMGRGEQHWYETRADYLDQPSGYFEKLVEEFPETVYDGKKGE